MENIVKCYETKPFQCERLLLDQKQNNFTFKKLRTLSIMLAEGLNIEHLIALTDEPNFFFQKINKELFVLLSITNNELNNNTDLIFYSIVQQINTKLSIPKDKNTVFYKLNFNEFWQYV
jgi:hypothetical protein